ncbi:LytR/AlgR family response regulator transcription factor [Fibrella aquatilis]|uniref:LytTR family transcriptional regulator DNA-binding domain-containing protein n=1 Tax=Fibrella aquatilis TaxID=2817059 RepID=A0A939G874_9BACT|nr:LytTR family DNA-binding domain-containing protein [Fibrella aquatilis]MBO0931578.1 LytTR family transcriptional regulator DNA-binding domain-containing protein [Fibrella aquatilis]
MMPQAITTNAPADNSPNLRLYMSVLKERQHRSVHLLMSLESSANYTWLLWQNGERVLLPRTLKYMEGQLPPDQFIRLRRDYTVNLDYIDRIERPVAERMLVWLRTGECIEVARRRITPVRKQLWHHPILARYVNRRSSVQLLD